MLFKKRVVKCKFWLLKGETFETFNFNLFSNRWRGNGTAALSRRPTTTRKPTCVCWHRPGTTWCCTTSITAKESGTHKKWPAWWGSGCPLSQEAKAGRSEARSSRTIRNLFRNSWTFFLWCMQLLLALLGAWRQWLTNIDMVWLKMCCLTVSSLYGTPESHWELSDGCPTIKCNRYVPQKTIFSCWFCHSY